MKTISRYRFVWAALLGLGLTGCATPQAMLFNVDVLQPKAFTLDAEAQSVAVVATYGNESDSTASAQLALGAARYLETSNALEEGQVGAFTIPEAEYPGTKDKEYMEQLMMATGSGTLVMIRDIKFGEFEISRVIDPVSRLSVVGMKPIKARMEVYDAIADTTIFTSGISDSLRFRIPLESDLSQEGISKFLTEHDSVIVASIGAQIAKQISNQWVEEEWMLIDYADETDWHSAYKKAMDFNWEEAVNTWMNYTEDKNSEKASYAAFNIAVACQMLGETDLAINWISYALNKYSFQEARSLYKYLQAHKENQKN